MIRNNFEIQFFGLQRSGNHGVITWLLQQFEQPQYFLNNVAHFEDPFTHYRHSDVPNMVPLSRNNTESVRESKKELLLYSYENLFLPKLAQQALVPNSEIAIGRSENCSQVLIIREFYNWIVSRLKLYEVVGQNIDKKIAIPMLVDLWVIYAREFSKQSSFLKICPVHILFDLWVVDPVYREGILNQLGIAMRDNSNGRVPQGGGSSFAEDQGRPQVSTEGVLNRWQKADIDAQTRSLIESTVAQTAEFETLYRRVMQTTERPSANAA